MAKLDIPDKQATDRPEENRELLKQYGGSEDAGTDGYAADDQAEEQTPQDELISCSETQVVMGELPVVLTKCSILRRYSGEVYARCVFQSLTETPIRTVEADLLCRDASHLSLPPVEGFSYRELGARRGDSFGEDVDVLLPDPDTGEISVVVQRLELEDGTVLRRSEECLQLPEAERLDKYLGSGSLEQEYARLTYRNVKNTPIKAGAYWRCSCGTVNREDEEACHRCGDRAEVLFANLDVERVKTSLENRIRMRREQEEQERRAREAAELREQEEQERREREEARKEKLRAERRKRRRRAFAILFVTAAVLALGLFVTWWQVIPFVHYSQADEALAAGDRETAYNAFRAMGDYRDSRERAYTIRYEDARHAFADGDYDKAIELFGSIAEYGDSANQVTEITYLKASGLMKDGDYLMAAALFEQISDYRDSADKAENCRNEQHYLDAAALLEAGNYEEAADSFAEISGYRDSAEQRLRAYYLEARELIDSGRLHDGYLVLTTKIIQGGKTYKDSVALANSAEYQYADACFSEGKFTEAAEAFDNLPNYEDSAERALEARYQNGLQLLSDGSYEEAERQFADLGDYKDSVNQSNEAVYQHGLALLEAKQYDEAAAVFAEISAYRDSAKQQNEARYQKGLSLIAEKKYAEAEALFAELGNYSDSQNQIKEAKYRRAMDLKADGKYTQAEPIFKELGYYSDSVEQWKATMYAYVLAHKNNDDKTTFEYLKLLRNYNYQSSRSIYDDLYTWKATIVLSTSANAAAPVSSISRYQKYLELSWTVTGGTPGEKINVREYCTWPNWYCDTNFNDVYDGYHCSGYWDDIQARGVGTFTVKLTNKATGALIATLQVKIT